MRAIQEALAPELINRIDEQLIFNRLSPSTLRDIVDIRLKEVAQRLAPQRIRIDVSNEAKDWLAEHGYEPRYGARPLNRLITKTLLNPLARAIIKGTIRSGDLVPVEKANEGVVILEQHEELSAKDTLNAADVDPSSSPETDHDQRSSSSTQAKSSDDDWKVVDAGGR